MALLLIALLVLPGWAMFAFNRLVRLRNQMRTGWADIDVQRSPARVGEVETALEQALGHVLALQEAYPQLKASTNFVQLQRDLVTVEDHLQYARRFYNGAVRDYNDAVQRVPDALTGQAFAFDAGEFYQAQATERAAVRVQRP